MSISVLNLDKHKDLFKSEDAFQEFADAVLQAIGQDGCMLIANGMAIGLVPVAAEDLAVVLRKKLEK